MTQAPAKPYLRGKPADGGTPKAAAAFLGGLLLMCVLNLILTGNAAIMRADWLRIGLCVAQLLVYYALFFYNGQGKGTAAVALGETLYSRKESGKTVDPAEEARCYHPLKGLVTALLGCLPALILTVVYAFMTQRQKLTPGALPAWVAGNGRTDVLEPLVAYTTREPATLVDYLRVAVRTLLMPWVTIVGSGNADAVLTVEHLGPLLTLLPAAAYAAGWCFGPRGRARVQEDIAEGKRRLARKQRREKNRRRAERGPEQLN